MIARTYNKPEWRSRNAEFVRGVRNLRNQRLLDGATGRLRCRVLDLAGEEPQPVWDAYSGLLSNPRDLLLVELDPMVYAKALVNLMRMPAETRPQLVCNDAYALGSSINHRTHKRDAIGGPLIGVVSLDLLGYAGKRWWGKDGAQFFCGLVDPAVVEYGVCAVILNHTMDGRMGSTETLVRVEEHFDCFRRLLRSHTGREVPRRDLLPPEADVRAAVLDRNFVGRLGSAQVYRSRHLRMVTIRMYLQSNQCYIDKE